MKKNYKRLSIIVLMLFLNSITYAQLNNEGGLPYQWRHTDTTKHIAPLSELLVVMPRGAFPDISYPGFLDKALGLKQFYEHEPVIAVEINGKAKAYPLNILTMHEITNDLLDDVPILPTYCPLCNASIVYDRRIKHNGKDYLLNFEVSGMLRKSDMVMADKETESWWQQLTGQCLVGQFAGTELTIIPSLVISVKEFFDSYPDGLILSPYTNTVSTEGYGTNPYVEYDKKDGKPIDHYFSHSNIDDRIAPMERVIDVRVGDDIKAYPFSSIAISCVINDKFKGEKIVIFYEEETISVLDKKNISESRAVGSATLFSPIVDGKALIFEKKDDGFVDQKTGSKWDITGHCFEGKLKGERLRPLPHSNHFAFAFLHFYPKAEIYKAP